MLMTYAITILPSKRLPSCARLSVADFAARKRFRTNVPKAPGAVMTVIILGPVPMKVFSALLRRIVALDIVMPMVGAR